MEILQNKNAATRFQIMVEIAASGPSVQQKTIAGKLGVTPQAISDYIQQLVSDKLVISTGRSQYRVSAEGVNWMLAMLRELHGYAGMVEKAVTNITVCAAVADEDISKGQAVGLEMKYGLLYATSRMEEGASGKAISTVKQGEDVDVANVEGLVKLTRGKITILQVPISQKGGSRQANLEKLGKYTSGEKLVGAIGIEAVISLRKINAEPRYLYGVTEAAVEATHCALPFTIVCTEDAIPNLMKRLREEEIEYSLVDLRVKAH